MSMDAGKSFRSPVNNDEEWVANDGCKKPNTIGAVEDQWGKRAQPGAGAMVASSAGAAGTVDGNEDYDSDDVGGDGRSKTGVACDERKRSGPKTGAGAAGEEVILPPGSKSL